MKTTNEMIAIMQAYAEGAEIEVLRSDGWVAAPSPQWNWNIVQYRVKPKQLKWCDNIPKGGILCEVWDETKYEEVDVITQYALESAPDYPFLSETEHYKNARPFTKSEILVLLNNAPEEDQQMSQLTFTIEDEDNIPQELIDAIANGDHIQVETVIGWVDVEDVSFRTLNTYKVVINDHKKRISR